MAADFSSVPNYVSSVTTNGNVTNLIAGNNISATIVTNPVDNTKSVTINWNQSSSTNISNPIVGGAFWTNKTGLNGILSINGTLTGNLLSGFPGICVTNLITGEFANPTNSFVLGAVSPYRITLRVNANDYVITTNKSSGSATASITSSFFIAP